MQHGIFYIVLTRSYCLCVYMEFWGGVGMREVEAQTEGACSAHNPLRPEREGDFNREKATYEFHPAGDLHDY